MNTYMLVQAYDSHLAGVGGRPVTTADLLKFFSTPPLDRKGLKRLRWEELEQKPENSEVPTETKGWEGQDRLWLLWHGSCLLSRARCGCQNSGGHRLIKGKRQEAETECWC